MSYERSREPLKIAIIISEFPSLNETFVMDHITSLMDHGHSVDIYATAPKGEPKIHDEVTAYDLLGRTTYRDHKRFEAPEGRLLRLRNATPLLIKGFIQNPKAALNSINVFRAGRTAASLRDLFEAGPFITRSCDYDIIHCHFPPNGQLAVQMRDRGVISGKIITSFHGYNLPHFNSGQMWNLYGDLASRGDLFLTCSKHMKTWYERHGWGEGRTVVHQNSLRTELFSHIRPKPVTDGDVRLLSVGRLVEKKGFKYAILAVAKLLQKFPNLQYEIVGDGEDRPELEKLIADHDASRNIRLVGWRNRSEILHFYENAHVFLAPSVTSEDGDQEGAPLVLIEALAAGMPAISTQHTGIPELVQDGESGFLVPERDPGAIADRLTYLLDHPEMWGEMGQKGRRHVVKGNELRHQRDRLVHIYRLLLAEDYHSLQKLA